MLVPESETDGMGGWLLLYLAAGLLAYLLCMRAIRNKNGYLEAFDLFCSIGVIALGPFGFLMWLSLEGCYQDWRFFEKKGRARSKR